MFYVACGSVITRSHGVAEPVRVQLIKSFRLPLLVYCIGALSLKRSAVHMLSVCWNYAFRRIFNCKRSESVRILQVSLGRLTLDICIRFTYTVSQKNCTPKAGRHKFIKISSPIMIFHTRHRHSVADWLTSKSLVRVEYQLQGFHGKQAPWQTTVVM